jgi:hypothetical protein
MKINGQPLHKLKKAYKQARKACGMLNTLKDSAFRTTQRSKLFIKMNKLRAAINRQIAEHEGVIIDHTNKHGFHIYFGDHKSKGYATLNEIKTVIDWMIKKKVNRDLFMYEAA